MLSAVPTGLKILAYSPTDKSVGYFYLSLWDKTQIYKNLGMRPYGTCPAWHAFLKTSLVLGLGSRFYQVGTPDTVLKILQFGNFCFTSRMGKQEQLILKAKIL